MGTETSDVLGGERRKGSDFYRWIAKSPLQQLGRFVERTRPRLALVNPAIGISLEVNVSHLMSIRPRKYKEIPLTIT